MNERLAQLYNQAIVLENNGDYVAGELDPVRFAESIIAETCKMLAENKEFRAAVLVGKHFPLWK
jgi:hypothetical protein